MKPALSLILSFLFLLWFIVSLAGMVYVSRSRELYWLIPVILGQFFLVFGTAGFIVMRSAGKKGLWIDVVVIIAGAVLVILPLIFHYGSEETRAFITGHIPELSGAGLLTAGLLSTLASYIGQKRDVRKYTRPVEGVCIERKTRIGSGGSLLYCPVYEISLKGQVHRMEKEVYFRTGLPKIGETRTLYIDDNDLESYREPVAQRRAGVITYGISLSFMAAGIIILVVTWG